MDVSPRELRKQIAATLRQVEAQIEEVELTAEDLGIPVAQVKDKEGNWPMIPLLQAKAVCYAALVELNQIGKK